MLTRTQLEEFEKQRLAPYAARAELSKGRKLEEEQAGFRTEFQRDRDRIVHSSAFRRLEYKTQVFVNHEGDHYRTRLTHSLEVSQIARTVARTLGLNEDLTEALVLSHDLGHTPFGHAGERVMSELMKEHGGFEHNKQSLRIVDELEQRYPNFSGLNLTFEVREGIVKHSGSWKPENVPQELIPNEKPYLEAQLIDVVDEIAYNNHDVDDGIASRMLSFEEMEACELWRNSLKEMKEKFPGKNTAQLKYATISRMITVLVSDLIDQTSRNLKKHSIETPQDARTCDEPLISFSSEIAKQNQELKRFLKKNLYSHFRVIRMEEKAKRILSDLFKSYINRSEQLPIEFQEKIQKGDKYRVICDYIAGMTDRFALDEYKKLFDPHTKV